MKPVHFVVIFGKVLSMNYCINAVVFNIKSGRYGNIFLLKNGGGQCLNFNIHPVTNGAVEWSKIFIDTSRMKFAELGCSCAPTLNSASFMYDLVVFDDFVY
jgi:hypothetical protein